MLALQISKILYTCSNIWIDYRISWKRQACPGNSQITVYFSIFNYILYISTYGYNECQPIIKNETFGAKGFVDLIPRCIKLKIYRKKFTYFQATTSFWLLTSKCRNSSPHNNRKSSFKLTGFLKQTQYKSITHVVSIGLRVGAVPGAENCFSMCVWGQYLYGTHIWL